MAQKAKRRAKNPLKGDYSRPVLEVPKRISQKISFGVQSQASGRRSVFNGQDSSRKQIDDQREFTISKVAQD
jgi:hypothetical protein